VQGAWLRTNYTSWFVVHEAIACPACPWFNHHITVVELVAEGELDWLFG